MSKLYKDILYPIFEELQYDKNSLVSCLKVNKIWCEIIIPILWKNPWEGLNCQKEELLLDTIILHLSDEVKNNLTLNRDFKKPLFNYISFCKHLNLEIIEDIFHTRDHYKKIKNDILKLFINEDAEYTHLYMPYRYDYHLIPEVEQCFSKIKFLRCDARINDDNLSILTKMCKSIKVLELFIYKYDNNHRISELIKKQESLISVSFLNSYYPFSSTFCSTLENSLIKHANTIQYFNICGQLQTQILASFVNLKYLVLIGDQQRWRCIESLSLPSLQILYTRKFNTESLADLIKRSGGKLNELSISYSIVSPDVVKNKEIIRAIYQNCPNLTYLEFFYKNGNASDLEELLIKCQYLEVLEISYNVKEEFMNWDNLFKILAKSSPLSLFKFKFVFPVNKPKLESLKLFFDNWRGRRLMSLTINIKENFTQEKQLNDLIGSYKEIGVIKEFVHYSHENYDLEEIMAREAVKNLKIKSARIFNRFKKLFD